MSSPADIRLVLSLAAVPGTSGYKMHNAGYKALGLNYLYLPRQYESDIAPALEAIRTLGIRGVSLTMPYKLSALPFMDTLSPAAEKIGAINTVVNDGGKLTGHNTDAPAAGKLIEDCLPWKEKPWIIFGNGGMAHALAYVAHELNADAYICARDVQKAEMLAKKFQLKTIAWGNSKDGAIIFNATPIGMTAHIGNLPVTENYSGAFDAVASPADTALIKAARTKKLPVISGDMLSLEQACLQFELYTGKPAPRGAMREALYA